MISDVFNVYLNGSNYVCSTAAVVVSMPWLFKFLSGLINELAIKGYRRNPTWQMVDSCVLSH